MTSAPVAAAALCAAVATAGPPFLDPLAFPSRRSALAPRAALCAVAASGDRLVAVGERGHILGSDDLGATWTQADVPVSADLTSVHFPSPERGWAAGHGGALLTTRDGGRSWARGASLAPDASILDLWFADARSGFAVGAFGLILRTEDGGESWSSWRDRTENPRELHLYAIARAAGALWIAGEQGLLLRLDPARGRFRAVRVPYRGSFFGVTGCGSAVVAYGLRGHVVRSADGGATWREVPTGEALALTGAALLPDRRLALVSQGGALLLSPDCGATFRTVARGGAARASALAPAGAGALVVVGPAGARVETLR